MNKLTKENSHKKIAWRLSGKILGEQISAFIFIDVIILAVMIINNRELLLRSGVDFENPVLSDIFDVLGNIPYLDLGNFAFLLTIVGVQVICVVVSTIRLRGDIKKQLEPLRELRIAADAYAGVNDREGRDALKRMSDALGRVDAGDMDAHIPAEAISSELRPLAIAINDMLNRIESSYEAQAKFVSNASHELRTPIAVIQGYANMLSRWGSEDPETLQESIEAIKSEAESMKQLVNQLLFLARGDNDTMHLEMTDVNIRALMEEVLREETMIDSGHNINAKFVDTPVMINCDAGLIKQVVRILFDNSIKYTPAGESITLKLESRANFAQITVQDEGQGIPSELLPHIFDRFVRADESRTRNSGGSGLGLSIAKQIVDKHGGKISVQSAEGIGSKFTVILPLVAPSSNFPALMDR